MRKNISAFLPYVTSIGGLLSYEFLFNLRAEDPKNDYVAPETFTALEGSHPSSKRELEQQITNSWETLLERWDSISSRYLKMDPSEARTKWIIPLLESLSYDPQYNKQSVIVDENEKLSFHLSHKGWNDDPKAPYINCASPNQNLEDSESGEDPAHVHRRSSHDELQSFLNVTKGCKWGIVTNGIFLRVLRQFYHTTTKAYVEFDLENIFISRSFSDFRLLYRIAHISRFIIFDKKDAEGKNNQTCILEDFYEQSKVAGVSAGEDLRKNVKIAIESLANGFLSQELAKRMTADESLSRKYYAEILRVVYRMIFLLFAEQRGMLPTRGSLYAEEYSMNRLREIATLSRGKDDHTDLWEGLKVTFKMLKVGCPDPQAGVFAYNGTLFDDLETQILANLTCKNSDLCIAARQLTSIERQKVASRINYLDLGVEEIGSIYESLLDYTPKIANANDEVDGKRVSPHTFYLDPRGAARRATGSYYTDRRLIDELIHSALAAVLQDRLSKGGDKESALLSIKVCDPACGSGAFLIAANNFLARELAKIRNSNQLDPPEKEIRRARREILQHCIYGVDVNPMAVELAKVSLWINAAAESVPLNFLDHHIKCGNSLIGTTPELIEQGIPSEAFKAVGNDDKEIAKKMERLNKSFADSARLEDFIVEIRPAVRSQFEELTNLSEEEVLEVEAKRKKYSGLVSSEEYLNKKFLADSWVSAFFWAFTRGTIEPPMSSNLHSIQKKGVVVDHQQAQNVKKLSEKYHFFHWHLEFPEIFASEGNGFDCILGNPPWEKIRTEAREWFKGKDQSIADCESEVRRTKMIEGLATNNPLLFADWTEAQFFSRKLANFIRASGIYKFTNVGDSNTYALFAEHARAIINSRGRIGLVVKTGIATDDPWKDFFGNLITTKTLCSLYDFQNSKQLFRDVAAVERFCLLTVSGKDQPQSTTEFAFLLTDPDQLAEDSHKIRLEAEAIQTINPNTRTLASFQTQHDAEIVKSLHERWPILIHEEKRLNPWSIDCVTTMVHMTMNADLFQENTKETLERKGFSLESNGIFSKGNERFLPLWEAKFFNQFDHRFATFEGVSGSDKFKRRAGTKYPSEEQKRDPDFEILPRYWVSQMDFSELTEHYNWQHEWMFAFRNVTRMTTDTRSTMGTILPWDPISYSAHLIFFRSDRAVETGLLFTGIFTSIVLDYVLRQKIGGTNFSAFILNQLPVPPPEEFERFSVRVGANIEVASKYIMNRVLKLVWTSHSLDCLGQVLHNDEGPFTWNREERRKLRTEIDLVVAKIYGVKKEELVHMCETFRIQKNKDMEEFGRFRTMEDMLEGYDSLKILRAEEVVST